MLKDRIRCYLQAGYPLVAVRTQEEATAIGQILESADGLHSSIMTWSATEGLCRVGCETDPLEDTESLFGALSESCKIRSILGIFRDIHGHGLSDNPVLIRLARDTSRLLKELGSAIIFVGSRFDFSQEVEGLVAVIDLDLPGPDALESVLDGVIESAGVDGPADRPAIIKAASGLTGEQAENAFALSVVETGGIDSSVVYREKQQAVRRSGLLDIVDPEPEGLEAIGGMQPLKDWLIRRSRAFSPEAVAFGLPDPRGIMIAGVPGTGKSLAARCAGTAIGVPTVRLDLGKLFGSLIGQSEDQTRRALSLAEAIAPCVLWLDEIEKGLGTGDLDGGTSRRVLGTILTWLQERRSSVFCVATANDVSKLPPELTRAGRWDSIWAVDLPGPGERDQILRLHLRKRGRPGSLVSSVIINALDGYTGAEIEQVVVEALFLSFEASMKDLTLEHLLQASEDVIPLSRTRREEIESIRIWARTRARLANSPEESGPTNKRNIHLN